MQDLPPAIIPKRIYTCIVADRKTGKQNLALMTVPAVFGRIFLLSLRF